MQRSHSGRSNRSCAPRLRAGSRTPARSTRRRSANAVRGAARARDRVGRGVRGAPRSGVTASPSRRVDPSEPRDRNDTVPRLSLGTEPSPLGAKRFLLAASARTLRLEPIHRGSSELGFNRTMLDLDITDPQAQRRVVPRLRQLERCLEFFMRVQRHVPPPGSTVRDPRCHRDPAVGRFGEGEG